MRVVIIGGSGHIGSYLTPRLVEAGHHVLCVSRGQRQPYVAHAAWNKVESRDSGSRRGGVGGHLRREDPRLARRLRDRSDGVHTREHATTGGGAARPDTALPALRHDLGARTRHRVAGDGRTAAQADQRLWRSQGGDRGIPAGRGAAPSISRNRAPPRPPGWNRLGAVEPGGELQSRGIRRSGRGPGDRAAQFGPRDTAPRACRRRGAGVHAGDGPLVRGGGRVPFTWSLQRRCRWRVMRRLSPGGSGARRASGSCRGRSGVRQYRKRKRRSPGTTSRDRRIAAFARRSACSSTGRDTGRSKQLRESVAWLVAKGVIEARFPEPAPGWNNLVKECR